MPLLVFLGLSLVSAVLMAALVCDFYRIREAYREYCATTTDPYRNIFEFLFTPSDSPVSRRKRRAAISFVLLIAVVWLSRFVYVRYLVDV